MKLLSVDPGETTGLVLLSYKASSDPPRITSPVEWPPQTVEGFVLDFQLLLRRAAPDIVVVEDYRVYASRAGMHVGKPLYTAELIGSIHALCVLERIKFRKVPASWKNRWPDARLKAKFPIHRNVKGVHERDALKLGLAYIEKKLGWEVNK